MGSFETKKLVQFGVLSEECGFDFCGFTHDAMFRNPWPIISAVASKTSKIELSFHASLYKMALDEILTLLATLDELSSGRMALSLGEPSPDMLDWFDLKAFDPVGRAREAISIIRQSLSSKAAEFLPFGGKEFRWSNQAYLRFRPLRANPPIHIYAHTRPFIDLAVELADGVAPIIYPPEAAPNVVSSISRECQRINRKKDNLDIIGAVWISLSKEDPRKARDLLRPIVSYYGPLLEEEQLNTIDLSLADFSEIKKENDRGRYDLARELVTEGMLELGITGTPLECIERLISLKKAGVTSISFGGPLGPSVPSALEEIGREILPSLR